MAKKTSVSINGIGKSRDLILKFLHEQIKDPKTMNEVGALAVEQIKGRTRNKQEEYKQDELKDSTVKRRKDLIRAGNGLSDRLARPKQSNLTLSGQLLDSIRFKISTSMSIVTIFLNDYRKPYTGLRGKPLENKSNKEIKDDLESRGRRFLFISDAVRIRLQQRITKVLRTKLSIYKRLTRK